jgi:peptidoglycan/xylan/chitin deacetylase (PgdA/CDA1 family)
MKVKGIVATALALCLFAVTGCATQSEPIETPSPTVETPSWADHTWVHDWGELQSVAVQDTGISGNLNYPQTGIKEVDEAIGGWLTLVQQEAAEALQSTADPSDADDTDTDAGLNIDYDAYTVETGYASVVQLGWLTGRLVGKLSDPVAAFNVDTVNGKLLANDKIIDPGKHDVVLTLLRDKLSDQGVDGDIINGINDASLNNLSLTDTGISVTIPGRKGFQGREVPLSKTELGDAYVLPAQAEKELPPPPPPDAPMIALTYDDGPGNGAMSIVDTLKQYNAHATFFNLGWRVDANPERAKAIVEAGNQIGNHSWDHPDLTKLPEDQARSQLANTSARIEQATGVQPTVCRPPYGAVNDMVKTLAVEQGCAIVNWSVDTNDWQHKDNPQAVHDWVLSHAEPGAIILMHDIYESTAEATKTIVPDLLNAGYRLVTIDELYASQGGLTPGTVHYHG